MRMNERQDKPASEGAMKAVMHTPTYPETPIPSWLPTHVYQL